MSKIRVFILILRHLSQEQPVARSVLTVLTVLGLLIKPEKHRNSRFQTRKNHI